MHVWVARLTVSHVVVIVLGYQFQCLFEHFPELDRLVCDGCKQRFVSVRGKVGGSVDCAVGMTAGRWIRTICTEQKVSGILSSAPLDLVDLFFDFERLEVVELGLVRLKLGMELVLAALFLW